MSYHLTPKARADISAGYEWIDRDNPDAAEAFMEAVKHTCEQLGQFPEFGVLACFKAKRLEGVRFTTAQPPFQKWIIFYRPSGAHVEVGRVIYGSMNWRHEPRRFF